MKKLLLSLIVFLLCFTSAKAQDSYNLQFCGDMQSWIYVIQQNKTTYKCYIRIPADMATSFAGNTITSVTFSAATDFKSNPREGSVFVTDNLEGEPTTSTACSIVDCYSQGYAGGEWFQTVTLDEPYTIKADTEFYFGYIVNNVRYSSSNCDYPAGIDNKKPTEFAGYIEIYDNKGNSLGTLDMQEAGTNLFLAARMEGDVSSMNNLCSVDNILFGGFTFPVKAPGDNSPVYLPVRNIGSNNIETLEYRIGVNGQMGEPQTLDVNLAPNVEDYFQIPAPKYAEGRNNVTINVTKVNDKETDMTTQGTCVVIDKPIYDRKFVVEEGTGTWCGYCPRGIVGLEYMTKKYPDTFIGIAVHNNDAMAVNSYMPITSYFDGYPCCIINRDQYFIDDPNKDTLEDHYKTWSTQYAFCDVDLEVGKLEDNSLEVVAKTTFAFDETGADYRLAFVILEDGIVASQSNYYAGYPDDLEWWGSQGSKVSWTFEHTARDIFDCFGIDSSIPTSVVGGEPVYYRQTLSSKNVSDIDQTSVVALVLDGVTGTILNATKVKAADYKNGELSVDCITDNAAPAKFYNLNGQSIDVPQQGSLIIRRQGKDVTKMIAK